MSYSGYKPLTLLLWLSLATSVLGCETTCVACVCANACVACVVSHVAVVSLFSWVSLIGFNLIYCCLCCCLCGGLYYKYHTLNFIRVYRERRNSLNSQSQASGPVPAPVATNTVVDPVQGTDVVVNPPEQVVDPFQVQADTTNPPLPPANFMADTPQPYAGNILPPPPTTGNQFFHHVEPTPDLAVTSAELQVGSIHSPIGSVHSN